MSLKKERFAFIGARVRKLEILREISDIEKQLAELRLELKEADEVIKNGEAKPAPPLPSAAPSKPTRNPQYVMALREVRSARLSHIHYLKARGARSTETKKAKERLADAEEAFEVIRRKE